MKKGEIDAISNLDPMMTKLEQEGDIKVVADSRTEEGTRAIFGGSNPAGAYRRFVTAGLTEPPESPWKQAHHGWILGSAAFADRVGAMVRGEARRECRRESRLVRGHSLARVCDLVCASYGIERSDLRRRGSPHPARAHWRTWRGAGPQPPTSN